MQQKDAYDLITSSQTTCIPMNFNSREGIITPVPFSFINATTYNMTIFAFNGTTWMNFTLINNETLYFMNYQFGYTILNQTIFIQDNIRYCNVTVDLTYPGNDLERVEEVQLGFNCPAYPSSMENLNSQYMDAQNYGKDFSTSAVYTTQIYLGTTTDPFWGDFNYTIGIDYESYVRIPIWVWNVAESHFEHRFSPERWSRFL